MRARKLPTKTITAKTAIRLDIRSIEHGWPKKLCMLREHLIIYNSEM